MASISKQPNSRRTIQFVAGDGRRRSIRLGKVSQRVAEAVKIRVENLNAAKIHGHAVDDETAHWLVDLDDDLSDKLARVDLIPRRERATLAGFIDAYVASRTDTSPATREKWRTTRGYLVEHFGTHRPLREITPGCADEWRLKLAEKGYAENTIRKHIAVAKVFFNAALRKRLLRENPFDGQKASIQPNPDREFFVTREMADEVLAQCPDNEWRLIFALSRFGGLRCPSELLLLRWNDVDWERERLTIHSPKTEHHAGKATRVVPLFPEIKPHLEAVFDAATPGTEYVITRYRESNTNLRTPLEGILHRASLEPWPKLFQNLRSSRQTELEEIFPTHVVCRWLGNSRAVAANHYLQVTDEHFAKAVQDPVQSVQKAVQQPAATNRTDTRKREDCDAVRVDAAAKVAEVGLEPTRGIPPTGL